MVGLWDFVLVLRKCGSNKSKNNHNGLLGGTWTKITVLDVENGVYTFYTTRISYTMFGTWNSASANAKSIRTACDPLKRPIFNKKSRIKCGVGAFLFEIFQ